MLYDKVGCSSASLLIAEKRVSLLDKVSIGRIKEAIMCEWVREERKWCPNHGLDSYQKVGRAWESWVTRYKGVHFKTRGW